MITKKNLMRKIALLLGLLMIMQAVLTGATGASLKATEDGTTPLGGAVIGLFPVVVAEM